MNGPEICNLPEGLAGDARRQAPALFKGVDFQIWLTIDSWMNLEENQVLVIEGVEDFDVVNQNGGTVTQVKAHTQPISLRSESATDALRNFWQAKHSNPGRNVRYAFITTARTAVEQGEPLGVGSAGISLWSKESKGQQPTDVSENLRRFLIEDESVRSRLETAFTEKLPPLVDFLRNSDAKTIFEELIKPISWLTDHAGVEAAKQMVTTQLHAYGEKKDVLPTDCDRALNHLFTFVAHKAFKEHRNLSREDFRLEFERAITPGSSEIAGLQLVAAMARQLFGRGDAREVIPLEKNPSLDVPRLPIFCVKRVNLVNQISTSLLAIGFIALHGSTGKGKSTLAKLAITTGEPWTWFSFAGMDSKGVSNGLDRAASFAAAKNSPLLILDNLDVPVADEPRIARKLAGLFLLANSRGGQIIVTSQRTLPPVFLREAGVPESALLMISNLAKEEIQELCRQAGCPDEQHLVLHAAVIFAQTGGHPQLVNAAVSTRRSQGWPPPALNKILEQAPEIMEERKIARQLLDVLSLGEVELLSRLSLLSISFRRDQAIVIGEVEPPIAHPGNCFDKLVGPWIEPASGDRYRLSSLLSRVAEDNSSKERITSLRGKIGRAILRSGNLTQSEASEILMEAVLTKDPALALPILKALYLSPVKERILWADALWWMLALTERGAIFPTDPMVTFLFRQVQFKLAVASNHECALQLAETLMNEAGQLKMAKAQDLLIAGMACDILLALKTLIPPKLLLRCWLSIITSLSSKILLEFARTIERDRPRRFGMPKQSFSELFFGFILCRRGGSDFLRQFLNAVDELNGADKNQVLAALRANKLHVRHFVDQAWTNEAAKPIPEWNKAITFLREICNVGERWGFPEMTSIAARGMAVIYDEYLKSPDEALKVLDEAKKTIGSDTELIHFQKGNVFYRLEQYQDAHNHWSAVRAQMKTDDFLSATDVIFNYPKFGEVAGRLSQWNEAQKIFLDGREITKSNDFPIEATAFGVDAAHALWLGGKRTESVILLAACFDELEAQAGDQEPDNFHTIWKITEHIARWCSINAGAPGQPIEVNRVGLCSESKDEERHNLVKDRPRAPIILLWIFLAEAELYADLGRTIYDRLVSRTDGSSFIGPRAIKAFLVLRRAFHDGEFSHLPKLVEEIAIASEISKSQPDQNYFTFCANPPIPQNIANAINDFAVHSFSSAILSVLTNGKDWQNTLGQWRQSAKSAVTNYDFEFLFNRIQFVMLLAQPEAIKVYQASTENHLDRLLSSVRLATMSDSSLSACFVGCLSLVTDEWLTKGYTGEGNTLGVLIRDIWRNRLNFKVEFNSARISVPAVEDACKLPCKGIKLAAHILLAAQTAVTTRVPDGILTKLRKFAALPD